MANTGLINYVTASRLLYGMACDRHLPRALFRIHPVRHTPDVAIGLIFVLIVILILSGDLSQLASATVLLLLLVFSVVNNALAILKLRPSEPQGAFELSLAVPVLGARNRVASGFCAQGVACGVMTCRRSKRPAPEAAGVPPPEGGNQSSGGWLQNRSFM